jgi:uridine phosphorylase
VISVSHGMGAPSISILLHEIYKLLVYAGAEDFAFIRVGTCGGVGVEPGTVVITEKNLNGELQPYQELPVLGEMQKFSTEVDPAFGDAIHAFAQARSSIPTLRGTTMSTNCFYEGQGRLDGAICAYGKEDRAAFIERLQKMGVTNIEMEGVQFHSFCARVNIKCAMLCSVLVDRTKGDQVMSSASMLSSYSLNSQHLAVAFIKDQVAHLDLALH